MERHRGRSQRGEPEKKDRGRKDRSRSRGKAFVRASETVGKEKPRSDAAKPAAVKAAAAPVAAAKAGTAGQSGMAVVAVKQEQESYSYSYSSSDEQVTAEPVIPETTKVSAPTAAPAQTPAPKDARLDKKAAAASAKKESAHTPGVPSHELNLEQKKDLMNSFLSTAFKEVMK